MHPISRATLTFLTPTGQPYNGKVTLRGGVYKNDVYCPNASFKAGDGSMVGIRESVQATVTNGLVELGFDPSSFKTGDGEWQSSPIFTDLYPNTSYTFYQRYAENSSNYESSSSAGRTITTTTHDHYWTYSAEGDGTISITDATWIQRYIADFAVIDTFDEKAADVDGDGKVTIIDATIIQRFLADMHINYPVNQHV